MMKICKQCGREFECYDKNRSGRKYGSGRRQHNAQTCSRKCSRPYNREMSLKYLREYKKKKQEDEE